MLKIFLYSFICVSIFKGTLESQVGSGELQILKSNDSISKLLSFIEEEAQNDVFFFPMETDLKNSRQYYYGVVYKGNFFEAIQFCNYHNMKLLSIETTEENDFLFKSLTNFIQTGAYGFWTSGTLLPENHWVWLSTGRPIARANWTAPPANQNKNCLDLNYNKSFKTLVWAGADCQHARHVICEITTKQTQVNQVTPS